MAEVDTGGGGGGKHKGGPKQKKKSTKVDMTAMVDVAFLLLTFFILTTTLASPAAMEIAKPPPNDEKNPEDENKKVDEKKIMTFILGENDQVHYYQGLAEGRLNTTDFGEDGVRKIIQEHLTRFPNRCPKMPKGEDPPKGCWDPIFVIKPNSTSRYKNVVDILDELRISGATKYSYTEVTPGDSIFLVDNRKK